MKTKTNLEITFSALNGHYLESNDRINTEYLNDAIVMWAMNTRYIYDMIPNNRHKVTAIVWEAFADLAENHIKCEERGYSCSSYQLKKWLDTYGDGYDTLKQAVRELTDERIAIQNNL